MDSPRPAPRGSRLRAEIMRAILVTGIGLTGAIVYRLTVGGGCHFPPHTIIDVEKESGKAYNQADSAQREIQCIERKAWTGEPPVDLDPADLREIGTLLPRLERARLRFEELMTLLRKKRLEDTEDLRGMIPCWLRTRVWILDARAVAGFEPGLYIPMNRALERWRRTRRELAGFRSSAAEIEDRDDADELRRALEQVREIRKALAECRDEFLRLEDFIRSGLRRDDLSTRDLPDLAVLREESALIQQAMASAGDLSLRFRK